MQRPGEQFQTVTRPELTESFDFDPRIDVESWRLVVPAKGACYVLEDADGRVVLLSTCGDLRRALIGRLGPAPLEEPTKKLDLRSVVRRVRWRLVFSRFEADWVYLENARAMMPADYRRHIKRTAMHWVCVDPEAAYPRFVATDRPAARPEHVFGPLRDGKIARGVIESLEGMFDLCRYHHILEQAPGGRACAYKQMGRCPAPCDGTIAMDAYRRQVREALELLVGSRDAWVDGATIRMHAAAQDQRFEDAARLKRRIDAAEALPADGLASLASMRFVAVMRGDGRRAVRVFAIRCGSIVYLGQVAAKDRPDAAGPLLERADRYLATEPDTVETPSIERASMAGWHRCFGKKGQELFLDASKPLDADRLAACMERVADPKQVSDTIQVIETDRGE